MKINKASMMFTRFSEDERKEMIRVARKIIIEGIVEWENPIVKVWMQECCENENQKLLVATCVLPQRILLSVVEG